MQIARNTVSTFLQSHDVLAELRVIVQAVGHADLFQDARGQWWGVSLAVRSGPEWVTFPMGRETILTNVTWEKGSWPVFHNPLQGDMRGWSLPDITTDLPGDG